MRAWIAVILPLLAAGPALGAAATAGQRLKVSGTWDGSTLHATQVQERDASKDARHGQVEGVIGSVDTASRSLQIGPLTVSWQEDTAFDGLSAEELKSGVVIEASGEMVAPMRLQASDVEAGSDDLDEGVVEIIGAVEESGGATPTEVLVLGVPVDLPHAGGALSALTVRGDDRRPEDQFTLNVLDRPLVIGGEVEAVTRVRDNFALDGAERLVRGDTEAQLEFFYPFAEHVAAFAELKAFRESELYQAEGDRETESAIERGEMWVYVAGLWDDHMALQIGRQNFAEDREWWWDADLDALRVYLNFDPWSLELATARDVARISTLGEPEPADQDLARVLGHVTWRWREGHRAEFFYLNQDDRSGSLAPGTSMLEDELDESDGNLTWLGLRAMGKTDSGAAGRLYYWVDTAVVRGTEEVADFDTNDEDIATVDSIERRDVRGWAVDLGASWTLPLSWEPTLTLGYALGSGDDGEGTDGAFRQTGLDNNNTKFRGVDRFRVYGELLQPELSNLGVLTASFGVELGNDRSVEVVYHSYRQQHAADELRDVRIDADLTGRSRDVGDELDLVFGFEHWKHLEVELIGSAFRSGEAFGPLSGEWAYALIGKVNYNF